MGRFSNRKRKTISCHVRTDRRAFWLMSLYCVCVLLSADVLYAEDGLEDAFIISSIVVEGNQRIEKEAILSVVMTRKGDLLDFDKLDRDLRDIYRMKYFMDVKIDIKDGLDGKIITFIVTEKPSIGEIVFKGNKKLRDEQLKEEVGLKLYTILDDNEIRQSINRLTDFYREKGYYNAEIKDKIESLPNNEVQLKYEITEHDKVYITDIKFIGNNEYDDDELEDNMESSKKGFFSWVTDSGFLNKKMLEYDVHMLAAFYHNNGYINAKVGEPDIVLNEDGGLTVSIEIEEGQKYGVNKVSIEGELILPEKTLLEAVQIAKEGIFSREVLRKDILALKDIYVDVGYAYADVTPNTRQDNEKHLVDIAYIISKGSKVRFERINIIGNTVTRDKVIRRELKAIEGGDYSGETLRKGTENLKRLGFFSDVEIETKKGSKDDLVILEVKVKEQPTGSFSVGAGYSSENALFATFQVSQNNFLGRGQRLQASANLGSVSSQFNVSITEPWMFDTRVSGTFNIYRTKQEYESYSFDDVDYDEYTRKSFGGRLGFGVPIDWVDEFTRGNAMYTYDDSDISDVPDDASAEWQDMEGRNVTSSITLGLFRDTRDEPWNTSKGSYNNLSFEFAGRFLGGDVAFNKIRLTSAWYFPLFWNTVFLVKGSWGYIEERSGGKLPVYQKFRIGGLSTVRGFEAGSISPRDPKYGDRIGGERMMYYNFEYRFPILKEQGITGLTFFDCGNVFEDHEHYTFSSIRKSAGVGIRWYSPMGPLRLEYGKNLDTFEGEKSGKWEFSMGNQF